MKRLIIITLVLMLAAGTALAQDDETGLTGKGLKAGINLANLTGNDAGDADMLLGFAFGGYLDFTFSPNMGLQTELLYSIKGSKESDIELKLTYLEVPLLLKYKFASEGSMKPALLVGPSIGILMSADVEGFDIKDQVKSLDLGLTFGVSIAFDNDSGGGLSIDGRYTLGMSKIAEDGAEVKNTAISILAGYGF